MRPNRYRAEDRAGSVPGSHGFSGRGCKQRVPTRFVDPIVRVPGSGDARTSIHSRQNTRVVHLGALMAEPFLINVSRHGPLARVELTGEVNHASAPLITERVFWYLEMESVDEVVIDMAGVSVIDSGGVSVLIRCKRRSLAMGKVLQVVASQGRVAQVLNLTGVDGYLAGSGGPEHAAG